jgi:hypothetical protein
MAQLAAVDIARLRERFEDKTARWLYGLARGFEEEPVRERDLPKSVGCSKNFPGPKMLGTREDVAHWLGQLAEEVCERLAKDKEANGRVARSFTVYVGMEGGKGGSKAGFLPSYDAAQLTRLALTAVASMNEASTVGAADANGGAWRPRVRNLSIAAGKFADESAGDQSIQACLAKAAKKVPSAAKISSVISKEELSVDVNEFVPSLDTFDPSILALLPPPLRLQVEARVRQLKAELEASGADTTETELTEDDNVHEKPSEEEGDEDESVRDEETDREEVELQPCAKCKRLLSPFAMPEHMDYHMAKELQAELSRSDGGVDRSHTVGVNASGAATVTSHIPVVKSNGTSIANKKTTKRKASEAGGAKEKRRQRDIASFFTRQGK